MIAAGRLSKLQEDVNMFVRDFNKKINSCSDAARDGKAELHNAMQSLQQWCHKQHMQQAELVQQCEEQVDRTSKVTAVISTLTMSCSILDSYSKSQQEQYNQHVNLKLIKRLKLKVNN